MAGPWVVKRGGSRQPVDSNSFPIQIATLGRQHVCFVHHSFLACCSDRDSKVCWLGGSTNLQAELLALRHGRGISSPVMALYIAAKGVEVM